MESQLIIDRLARASLERKREIRWAKDLTYVHENTGTVLYRCKTSPTITPVRFPSLVYDDNDDASWQPLDHWYIDNIGLIKSPFWLRRLGPTNRYIQAGIFIREDAEIVARPANRLYDQVMGGRTRPFDIRSELGRSELAALRRAFDRLL